MGQSRKAGLVETLNELAEAAGISLTGLANWRRAEDFPEQVNGLWSIWQVGFWRGQKEERDRRPKIPQGFDEDAALAGGDSIGLERYRMAKASLAELDLAERERIMLPADAVHDGIMVIAQTFRQASETLQRQFGPEAYAILEQACAEAQTQINDLFGPTINDTGHGTADAPQQV